MFETIGAPELLIIAVVVVLLFGVGKLKGLGSDLGSGIKEFRRALKEEDPNATSATVQVAPQQPLPVAQQPVMVQPAVVIAQPVQPVSAPQQPAPPADRGPALF
jgi:TatA/E family protein of Tat protein translocase